MNMAYQYIVSTQHENLDICFRFVMEFNETKF